MLTPPKSETGRRTVALPAFVLAALEDHLRDYVAGAPDSPAAPGSPSGVRTSHTPGAMPVLPWGSTACAPTTSGTTPPPSSHAIRMSLGASSWRGSATRRTSQPSGIARDGGAQQGDRRLPRRRHQRCEGFQDCVRVRIGACGMRHGCGMERTGSHRSVNETVPQQGEQKEAAGGIEPPYGALQAPASLALGPVQTPLSAGRDVPMTRKGHVQKEPAADRTCKRADPRRACVRPRLSDPTRPLLLQGPRRAAQLPAGVRSVPAKPTGPRPRLSTRLASGLGSCSSFAHLTPPSAAASPAARAQSCLHKARSRVWVGQGSLEALLADRDSSRTALWSGP